MKFDLKKSFLEKGTRVILSADTPFDLIKKSYDLIHKIELEDRWGHKYNISEDLLVRYGAFRRIVELQVEHKFQRGVEKFSDHFNELNEFEKQMKEYVESQEVISTSPNEIKYIENEINKKLKYNIINTQADKMINFLQDFKDDASASSIEELVDEFADLISKTSNDFGRLKNSFDDKKKSFNLSSEHSLGEILREYIRTINSDTRYVKTGIKWFNDTFKGWEKERLYLFLAASGRGKSVFLLNSTAWAIKYNSYEDVTKMGLKPVALYLTLENTIVETILRLLSYIDGNTLVSDFNRGKISVEDAEKLIRTELINKKDPLNSATLMIEYRNKGTQSMDDINRIIDDIEADGKHKVVFLAIDYIDSIKSDYVKKDDVRMGLSNIGTSLSNMAKDREIPVLTAMQLNRDATNKIEQGADDVEEYFKSMRSVGASHIAESLRLIQLVDMAMVIDKRRSENVGEGDILSYRVVKSRITLDGKSPTRLHSHNFLKGNGMRLDEDIYSPVSKSIEIVPVDGGQRGPSAPKLNPRR